MLATEIISKLKKKIRILWAIIIVLSVLLMETHFGSLPEKEKMTEPSISAISEENQIVYDIPDKPVKQNIVIYRKRSKKR